MVERADRQLIADVSKEQCCRKTCLKAIRARQAQSGMRSVEQMVLQNRPEMVRDIARWGHIQPRNLEGVSLDGNSISCLVLVFGQTQFTYQGHGSLVFSILGCS